MRAPRRPVGKHRHNFASTNVNTGAWVEIIDDLAKPCSYVEVFNSSGSVLRLSTGAAAAEDDSEISYYVLPNGSPIMLPLEFGNGARISARAVDANATVGSLIFNFFD